MQHYKWYNYINNNTTPWYFSFDKYLHKMQRWDTEGLVNNLSFFFSFLFFSFLFFLFNLPQVEQLTVIQCVGGLFKGGWVIQLWDDLGKMWR